MMILAEAPRKLTATKEESIRRASSDALVFS